MSRIVVRSLLVLALSTVLAVAQNASEALVSKARALEGRGRPDLAAQTWQQVLLADPSHQEGLASLARFAKQSGRTQESQAYLDRLRKVNPNHPALQQVQAMPVLVQQQARLREAARLVANQQFDQAMQIYRQVFGDAPPPGAMAIAYYETEAAVPGGWESATAGLQKFMNLYPAVDDYKLVLGKLWTYRPATRVAGMRLLESIKGGEDQLNKAKQAWRQALIWEAGNPQVLASARAYTSRYPDPELSKMFEGVNAAQHTSAPSGPVRSTLDNLGYNELKANRVKDAETLFENSLKQNPKNADALAGLGFVRMKQENFSEAATLFEAAAKESPKDKDIAGALETARFWSAMNDASKAFAADQLQEAVEFYRKALAVRPSNPEGLHGLGGALMKKGDATAAATVFEKLTGQQPQNEEAWFGLLNARYRGVGPDSALAAIPQLPGTVRLGLSKNIQYLAMMSFASSDAGKQEDSRRYLHQAIELSNAKGLVLSIPLQLQFAGLYLRHGYASEAATLFQKVVDSEPRNVDAWEGLLTSLIQTHQQGRAARSLEHMPSKVYEAAVTRPGALRSLAAISESMGQLEDAEKYLEKSIRIDTKVDDASNIAARLQLAHLWLAQRRDQQAETLLRGITASHPDNPDVWKALIAALHKQSRDEVAIAEAGRLPRSVSAALVDDPDYVGLMASVLNAVGRYDEALRLVRRASALMKQQNRTIPADLEIQLGWLLLSTNGDERELYALFTGVGARTDLTQVQQESVSELWSSWILRRANAASKSGDTARALAILEAGVKLLPRDAAIRSSYAGVLLTAGEAVKALSVYKSWGLTGAGSADFTGAIGAALGASDWNLATTWLRTALNRWPTNAEMLNLAGKLSAAKGDYKAAQKYWTAALAATPVPAEVPQVRAMTALKPVDNRPANEVIGELLLGGTAPLQAQPPAQMPAPVIPRSNGLPSPVIPDKGATAPRAFVQPEIKSAPQDQRIITAVKRDWQSTAAPVRQESRLTAELIPAATSLPRPGVPGLSDVPPQPRASLPQVASREPVPVLPAIAPGYVEPVQPSEGTSLRGEIQERLNAIESRNSSYFGSGGTIRARSGEQGFDRMILEEANFEASAVIAGGLRLTAVAHPTYLESGKPDGESDKRFGLAPKGALFDTQSTSGVGGELQLSTRTFGLRAGSTPRNFLVSNFVGGIRFRPGNGPITLLAEREVLRDSMLAFSGARDPVTNRVWGGVVANTLSILGNWGGEKSGFYTSFGFQTISGRQVQSNTRIDGNLGMYWKVLETPQGKLTAGFNLTGLHYEKNLRYFTLGHGGYFSPQQYILANVPIQWRGVYGQKIQYLLNGSFGAQHFQEESSPYFPTLPAVQGRNGPYYAKQSSSGANYSIDIQTAIPITPVWHLGIFANVNNTRNYNSAAAGVFIRYSIRQRPLLQNFSIPSIPDWRGSEPFRVY
ncbi:MAG: BCSC C-terminal domain-containing protein [Acidobacteria bacterium]|nr:BCSC C-terminal domain-containing protein [Acidobacteriota bacterium]